jgi:hypothetical protein
MISNISELLIQALKSRNPTERLNIMKKLADNHDAFGESICDANIKLLLSALLNDADEMIAFYTVIILRSNAASANSFIPLLRSLEMRYCPQLGFGICAVLAQTIDLINGVTK